MQGKQTKSTEPSGLSQQFQLLKISALGVMRGLVSLPLEHPFDTVKTWMQSQNVSVGQAVSEIYKGKGLKGFYSGFAINCARVMSKSAYRWPLNVYLIANFRRYFKDYGYSNTIAGVATGVVTAVLESAIICPFQRIKVWLMTSPDYRSLLAYFKAKHLPALFDGFLPVMTKQTLSWVSFLGSQEFLKDLVYKYKGKTSQQYELTTLDLTFISILVCFCNTAFVMPADYIKTHYQKYADPSRSTMRQFAAQVYRQGGLKQFYRGSLVKIIQYNINAFLTVQLFERVLRSYKH